MYLKCFNVYMEKKTSVLFIPFILKIELELHICMLFVIKSILNRYIGVFINIESIYTVSHTKMLTTGYFVNQRINQMVELTRPIADLYISFSSVFAGNVFKCCTKSRNKSNRIASTSVFFCIIII